MQKKQMDHVKLIFSPPEARAYGRGAEELWNNRLPTDYGTIEEFETYFHTISELLSQLTCPSVIFIDGHIREHIGMFSLNLDLDHALLLHDFSDDRDYLNKWVSDNCIILNVVDHLIHLKKPLIK
jgi:hypothetical protein